MDLIQEAVGSHQQMLCDHCGGFHPCLEWVLLPRPQLPYQPFIKDGHAWAEPAVRPRPRHCVHLLALGCLQSCRRRTASSGLPVGSLSPWFPRASAVTEGGWLRTHPHQNPLQTLVHPAGPWLTTLGLRTGSVRYFFLSQGRVPISWGGGAGRSGRQRDCILQLKASLSSLL